MGKKPDLLESKQAGYFVLKSLLLGLAAHGANFLSQLVLKA